MTAPRLTVATAQFAVTAEPRRNAEAMVALLRRAKEGGADVAHFPEGALSGYPGAQFDTWRGYDWAALEAAQEKVAAACRVFGLWAVYGSGRRWEGDSPPRNSVIVIDSDGAQRACYDKRCCSRRELDHFTPGDNAVTVDIGGVRCGILICLEWSFPQLWQAYAANGVDLVFLSAYGAGLQGPHLHTDVVPPTLQGHAFTNSLFISVSNASNSQQAFASHWVKRSGRRGGACRRHRAGLVVSSIADDGERDAFYRKVRKFRAARLGRLSGGQS